MSRQCKTIDICCDYAVCSKQLQERFRDVVEVDPLEVARAINDLLIDTQDPEPELCRICIFHAYGWHA